MAPQSVLKTVVAQKANSSMLSLSANIKDLLMYEYLEASMAGTYWTLCEILESNNFYYKIKYIDSFLDEEVEKVVKHEEVRKIAE